METTSAIKPSVTSLVIPFVCVLMSRWIMCCEMMCCVVMLYSECWINEVITGGTWMVLQRDDVYIKAYWLGISWHSFIRALIGSCEGYAWVHTLAKSVCQVWVHYSVVFVLLHLPFYIFFFYRYRVLLLAKLLYVTKPKDKWRVFTQFW